MANKLSPRMAYLEALGNQLQSVIDQIPENQERELREILNELLNRWEIYPSPDQEKMFLGSWMVDMMYEAEFIRTPNDPIKVMPQPIKREDNQSPLMWLEEWLYENLP